MTKTDICKANGGEVCYSCGNVLNQNDACVEMPTMDEVVCIICHQKYGVTN